MKLSNLEVGWVAKKWKMDIHIEECLQEKTCQNTNLRQSPLKFRVLKFGKGNEGNIFYSSY